MSTNSSPTTPKPVPASLSASTPPLSLIENTVDRVEYHKSRQPPHGHGDPVASARELPTTKASTPAAPGSSFKHEAILDLTTEASTASPAVLTSESSRLSSATATPILPTAASQLAGSSVLGTSDDSIGGSNTWSRTGRVPGNYYQNQGNYVMLHQTPRTSMRAAAQQSLSTQAISVPILLDTISLTPYTALTPPVSSVATYTPASATSGQVQAIISPPGTPVRLVLFGPLRMIRSHCVAKMNHLRPILVWLDKHMGESLRTAVFSDSMISDIVYAVEIPMTDEYWLDWNKVLSVFPRAAAWQEALTPGEPFDQVTGGHPTAPLFLEGEPLQTLLNSLVKRYNLGALHHVEKPWDAPGQTEWSSSMICGAESVVEKGW